MPQLPTFTNVKHSLPESAFTDPAKAYASGYVGAWADPEIDGLLRDTVVEDGGKWSAEDVVYGMDAAEQGKGQLSLLTEEVARVFGRSAMPGPAQAIGDCVSHSVKNGILATVAAHVAAGVQGKPSVTPEAVGQGVFATEALYWWRGHGGDGWNCSEAILVAMKKTGAVVRRDYPDAGVDLSRYSAKVAHRYGVRPPDSATAKSFGDNLVSSATRCRSWEEARDLIAAGYGLSSCGSEGFSNRRDDWGVSERQGRWAHAMAAMGADDRPETHRKYGGGLILMAQSWGPSWNAGPRAIHGTHLEIPPGFFWARWNDVKSRDWTALAVNGWSNAHLREWQVDV